MMMNISEDKNSSSESTRDLLIGAAKELFAKDGFDGTTVKGIVDRAGVNISLVSYHFAGKEGLFQACLDQFGKERLRTAQRLLQPAQSAEECRVRLEVFVQEMFETCVSEPDLVRMVHREIEADSPLTREIFKETFHKVFETLVTFFQFAQKQGYVRKELNTVILTTLFFGSMIHHTRVDTLCERYYGGTLKDPVYRKQVIQHLITIFMAGILQQPQMDAASSQKARKR